MLILKCVVILHCLEHFLSFGAKNFQVDCLMDSYREHDRLSPLFTHLLFFKSSDDLNVVDTSGKLCRETRKKRNPRTTVHLLARFS